MWYKNTSKHRRNWNGQEQNKNTSGLFHGCRITADQHSPSKVNPNMNIFRPHFASTRYTFVPYTVSLLSSPHSHSVWPRCAPLLTGETHSMLGLLSIHFMKACGIESHPSQTDVLYPTLFVWFTLHLIHGKWFWLSLWIVNQQMPHAFSSSAPCVWAFGRVRVCVWCVNLDGAHPHTYGWDHYLWLTKNRRIKRRCE